MKNCTNSTKMEILLGICVIAPLLLNGCTGTTSGTRITTEQTHQIEKGKTTEREILSMFGKPTSVMTNNGKEELGYTYVHTGGSVGLGAVLLNVVTLGLYTPVKIKTETTTLTVSVENGIVQNYGYSESGSNGIGY